MTHKNTKVISEFLAGGDNKIKAKNLFFIGKVLYSYGSHFPLAVKLSDGKFIINEGGYSTTTSTHRNHLIRAITNYQNLKQLEKAQKEARLNTFAEKEVYLFPIRIINQILEQGITNIKDVKDHLTLNSL